MELAKFFVVRFTHYNYNSAAIHVVRSFSLWDDAVDFSKRLNLRFPKYEYRVLNIKELNDFGILPF